MTAALDREDLGESVPASKADDIDERLGTVLDSLERVGPGVLGILGLLAHWATQSGGLEVDEDELIDEAWTASEQAWMMREEIARDRAVRMSEANPSRRLTHRPLDQIDLFGSDGGDDGDA